MFNPFIYENSHSSGFGVLQLTPDSSAVGGPVREARQFFVPLQRTHLTGTISGPLLALTLTQVFRFDPAACDHVIEALYRFPLPGDAAVTGVHVHFGTVEIVARLEPRAAAEEAYAQAKAEHRQAALVTRESPDVFTLQLAGLRPGEEVIVATSFVQLARRDDAGWSLRVPLTNAPRFVRADDLATDHAKGQPFTLLRDPGHRFALDLHVVDGSAVHSSTHALKLTPSAAEHADSVRVELAQGDVLPDRDCVLTWMPRQAHGQAALAVQTYAEGANQDDDLYLLAEVAPPATPQNGAGSTPTVPQEVMLLVDHSGSMLGPKRAAADWAVERFLAELHEHDFFNLCAFETSATWFARRPQPASPAKVADALAWIKSRHESGGTNLGVAMEQALVQPVSDGAVARNLLIVTDAAVSDAGRILRMADQEAAKSNGRRISVLCIDAAPNSFLVHELAERGGGVAKFLTSAPTEEDITTALDTVLTTWSGPVLADLRLVVNRPHLAAGGRHLAAESQRADGWAAIDFGDLPAGSSRWICARTTRGQQDLTVRVETADGALVAAQQIDLQKIDLQQIDPQPSGAELSAIKALFGVRRVNTLEALSTARYDPAMVQEQLTRLGYSTVASAESAALYAENQAAQATRLIKDLLVEESLRYGLASSAVGFVAVRAEAGEPVEARVFVANALPSGWSDDFLGAGLPSMTRSARKGRRGSQGNAAIVSQSPTMRLGTNSGVGGGPAMLPQMPFPQPSAPQQPASHGAPRTTWHVVFTGPVQVDAGCALLADDFSATIPDGALISGLRVEVAATDRSALEDARSAAGAGAQLLLYVGDLAEPRARVRLRDLLRQGGRPLNLRKQQGDVVRLVLDDPGDILGGVELTLLLEW
ncbi:MAG: VWA domain-containing protein [Caldilineaceae bacterium]|nr:VWA domain-containing protein [Caldilineaceae bacterium]